MSTEPSGRTIVVGYDGSGAARAAVAVACRQVLRLADRPVVVLPAAAVESGGPPRAE